MRLATLQTYQQMFFAPGCAPSISTIRRRGAQTPGFTVVGGKAYIDLDEFERQTQVRAALAAREQQLAADPRLADLA